ncbi:MAG: PKD domain-containing protein [Acidobacteriota bacterium]
MRSAAALVAVLANLAIGEAALAQSWQPLDPEPPAFIVTAIAVKTTDPMKIVVTTDPDGTWDNLDGSDPDRGPTRLGFTHTDIGTLDIHETRTVFAPNAPLSDPDRVYVLDKLSFLGTTIDPAGKDWESVKLPGWGGEQPWRSLAVSPSDDDLVLAGGRAHACCATSSCPPNTPCDGLTAVRRTTNATALGSAVWSNVAGVPGDVFVTDMEFDPYDVTPPVSVWASTARCWNGYHEYCAEGPRHGVLLSTDAGLSFAEHLLRANPLDDANEVNAVAVLPATVLAATDGGLYRCNDCPSPASSWSDVTPPLLGATRRVRDVLFADSPSAIAYAATDDGVWKSTDLGVSWAVTSLPRGIATALGGLRDHADLVYAGYDNSDPARRVPFPLYRAQSSGTVVTPISGPHGGFPTQTVAIASGDDALITVGTICHQGIWRGEIGALPRWIKPPQASHGMLHYPMRLVAHPTQRDTIYATVYDGLFRTTDGGQTWVALAGLSRHLHGLAIARAAPNILYVGSGHGIWGTPGGDIVWRSTNGGVQGGWTQSLISAATVAGWSDAVPSSLIDIAVDPRSPTAATVYVATFGHEQYPGEEGAGQGVLRSTDAGATWRLVTAGLPTALSKWVARIAMAVVGGDLRTHIATLDGVYQLTGATATTWVDISSAAGGHCAPCAADTRFEAVAVDPLDPSTIYAGTSHNTLVPAHMYRARTGNGGTTWAWQQIPITMLPHAWSVTLGSGPAPHDLDHKPIAPLQMPASFLLRYRIRDIAVGKERAYAVVEGAGVYDLNKDTSPCARNRAAIASFGSRAAAGQPVTLRNGCTQCTHLWSFGDGATSNAQNPAHPYAAGFYTVGLTTTDGAEACSASSEGYVEVWSSAPGKTSAEIVSSPGAGPSHLPRIRGSRHDSGVALPAENPDLLAYATSGYGAEVALGRVEPCAPSCGPANTVLPSILTAPGPAPNAGSQVRGFALDGAPKAKINFFAYPGATHYGAKVAAAHLFDVAGSDTASEILTGPGPGATFGPQVRGWDYDNVQIDAIPKVNFFAYGTLKYGVNVAGGDFLTGDALDEILTGSGPGSTFAPHVRGFLFDAAGVTPKVSFFAYAASGYGVRIAGGDATGDDRDEALTGRGPAPSGDSEVRAFELSPAPGAPFPGIAFPGALYGAIVSAGNVDPLPGCPTCEAILAGPGPDPGRPPRVRGLRVVPPSLELIPGLDFPPFGDLELAGYGAIVAGSSDL